MEEKDCDVLEKPPSRSVRVSSLLAAPFVGPSPSVHHCSLSVDGCEAFQDIVGFAAPNHARTPCPASIYDAFDRLWASGHLRRPGADRVGLHFGSAAAVRSRSCACACVADETSTTRSRSESRRPPRFRFPSCCCPLHGFVHAFGRWACLGMGSTPLSYPFPQIRLVQGRPLPRSDLIECA